MVALDNSKNICNAESINYAFWNIGGFKSKIIGNKLVSKDFLNEIQGNDFIGLAETHIHSAVLGDLAIPGYVLLKYINRKRNPKSHTAPGGLALFCKESVSNIYYSCELR